jgi:hypothetical protein
MSLLDSALLFTAGVVVGMVAGGWIIFSTFGDALVVLAKAGLEMHKDKVVVSTRDTRFGTVHFEHDGTPFGVIHALQRAYDYMVAD